MCVDGCFPDDIHAEYAPPGLRVNGDVMLPYRDAEGA